MPSIPPFTLKSLSKVSLSQITGVNTIYRQWTRSRKRHDSPKSMKVKLGNC